MMTKKWFGLLALLALFLIVVVVWIVDIKGDQMSHSVIPQKGVYEVSNYGFWTRSRTVDIVLKINSTIVYKGHEDNVFLEHANSQASSGIDELIRNGTNLLEVYFKQWPAEMFPETMHDFIATTEKYAMVYVNRNDNVYSDGRPYKSNQVVEVLIKFELDEEGHLVITTPEGTVKREALKVEPYDNGYTKVTARFVLRDARAKEWEKGMPYNDENREHRQLLEAAYVDFWYALNQRDWKKVKKIYAIALAEAQQQEPMIEEAMVYSMISPEDVVKEHGLRLMPMHPFESYEIETSDDGKLIRLVIHNDEGVEYSPIVFQNKQGEPEGRVSIAPWFSIIEGKAVLTLPF